MVTVLGVLALAAVAATRQTPTATAHGAVPAVVIDSQWMRPLRETAATPGDLFVARMEALGLVGSDWHQPGPREAWSALLRKAAGGIQVSCRIESSSARTIENAEIELEVYSENYTERGAQLSEVFRAAIAEVAPDLPEGTLDTPVPWAYENTRMERLPDTGSRNVLRFTLDGAAERN